MRKNQRQRSLSWWQFGLVGGFTLSIATAIKALRSAIRGFSRDLDEPGLLGFAAAIFGMGFVCGVIVWAGRGLHDRIGVVGDAVVGVAVMVVFFSMCMLMAEPAMLGARFLTAGAPMLGLAVVLGAIAGPWFGRDLRQ